MVPAPCLKAPLPAAWMHFRPCWEISHLEGLELCILSVRVAFQLEERELEHLKYYKLDIVQMLF